MSVTEENKAISYAGYESEEKSWSKGKWLVYLMWGWVKISNLSLLLESLRSWDIQSSKPGILPMVKHDLWRAQTP